VPETRADSAQTTVATTFLELRSLASLVPATSAVEADLVRAGAVSPEFARYLYVTVGGQWHWRDRLAWSWSEWRAHFESPGRELWYASVRGTPAGYFELDATRPPDVEVAYFGLVPSFMGQGLGAWLLEAAARRGFELGTRVWVHTCTLDGPRALPNYLARGFSVFRVEEKTLDRHLPTEPWPGANRPGSGEP
jgi:GNAT superfamily N-acetyltransferase